MSTTTLERNPELGEWFASQDFRLKNDCYLVSVTLKTASSINIKVPLQDLNLPDAELESLQKLEAKDSGFKAFTEIADISKEVKSTLADILKEGRQHGKLQVINQKGGKKYLIVKESDLEWLLGELNRVIDAIASSRVAIEQNYVQVRADYYQEVDSWVESKGLNEVISEGLVNQYRLGFKPLRELTESYEFQVGNKMSLTSLLSNSEFQEQAADAALNNEIREKVLDNLSEVVSQTCDDIFGLIAGVLADLQKQDGKELSAKGREKIGELTTQLAELTDFAGSLNDLLSKSSELIGDRRTQKEMKGLYTAVNLKSDVVELTTKLAENKASLDTELLTLRERYQSQIPTTQGKGIKKFAEFMLL